MQIGGIGIQASISRMDRFFIFSGIGVEPGVRATFEPMIAPAIRRHRPRLRTRRVVDPEKLCVIDRITESAKRERDQPGSQARGARPDQLTGSSVRSRPDAFRRAFRTGLYFCDISERMMPSLP